MSNFHVVLRPKPKPNHCVLWLNIYRNPRHRNKVQSGGIYSTRKDADTIANSKRLACVPIIIPLGQNQENRRPEKSGLTPPPRPAIMLSTMGEKPTP